MSLYLPVSSFPDVTSHDQHSLDLDVRIIVTPPPTRKFKHRLRYAFGSNIPEHTERTKHNMASNAIASHCITRANVSGESVYPGQSEAGPVIALTSRSPRLDEVEHHDAHHRSMSGDLLEHRIPWLNLPNNHTPRSTKESIATLGLSRRTPSPDSSSDSDSMVACCYTSGWVESQALPPLPPVPPPSPPSHGPLHLTLIPHSRSSSPGLNATGTLCITPSKEDDDDPLSQKLEISSQHSSVPPSPITFSHRNSVFVSMDPPQGVASPNEAPVRILSLAADSLLLKRAASPASSSQKYNVAGSHNSSSEPVADSTARPCTSAPHVSASELFAPTDKRLKHGETFKPPPFLSLKRTLRLQDWRMLRRRQSVSSDDHKSEIAVGSTAEEQPDSPSGTPSLFYRRKPHRNSIHFGSFSSPNSEPLSPRRSSVESDQTLTSARAADSPVRRLHPQKSMGNLRSVTTHRVAGDTWREEEIGSVIDTLRTLKVGKLR